MARNGQFENYDDEGVFQSSQPRALDESTRNFVVEFGKTDAQIAFNLEAGDLQTLLGSERDEEKPVRWINIWAPNRQVGLVELLGKHYKFSPRLLAIIKTMPPDTPPAIPNKNVGVYSRFHKDDIELATSSIDTTRAAASSPTIQSISQYDAAKEMINFQSIDVGLHFLCIGANWMHELPHAKKDASILDEGSQRRLWSWLVLCDDNTVLSLHEDPGPVDDTDAMMSIRGNTISVLSQLSIHGHLNADPTSMITVRQALELDAAAANAGVEGSSNLFYYLFDDWRAVYSTIAAYRARLGELEHAIIADMTRKSGKSPNIEIIPRLHVLGRRLRQMQGLYEGYSNLIQRIIEPKSTYNHGMTTPRSLSGIGTGARGVVLAQSATQRFERLGDRLQLLILSGTKEFLAEKDALISMYFSINTQKDSESSARLTRSATLLAKLSVLFLPVSLMTSYFSTQLSDIQGIYTVKDYWIVFAVMMSISFMGLFFFGRLLMWVTETLDEWVKDFSNSFAGIFTRKGRARRRGLKVEK